MDRSIRTSLTEDEQQGIGYFRECFFEALEHRQLEVCQAYLDILQDFPSLFLQRGHRYHQAILCFERRQFDRSERLLRELLAENLEPIMGARALLELGSVLNEQGQWQEAEQFFRQARRAYTALQDVLGQAKACNNLGVAIRFQVEQRVSPLDQLQKAAQCHHEALDLLKLLEQAIDNVEQIKWETERNWHGLGISYGQMGQPAQALTAFQKDITLCEELGDDAGLGISLSDMAAYAYQPLGRWEDAGAALNTAILLLQEHSDPLHLAEALTHRGNLLAAQGSIEAALIDYNAALDSVESIRARLTAPVVRSNYRTVVEPIYTAPLSLHLQRGEAEQAFNIAERARSRTLADILIGHSAQPHVLIPAHLLEQRRGLRQQLDQAYAAVSAATSQADLEKSLADLDHQIDLLDPTYTALDMVKPITATEVRQRLPTDSILLSYVSDSNDQIWIIVVSPTDVHVKPIQGLKVRWLQRYLADHLDGSRQGSLVLSERTGHLEPARLFPQLYKALIEPVADILKNARTIYIIPFGPLHYVPLGALTQKLNSSPPLLAPGCRVVYAPSATVLLNYCHQRPPSPYQGILAMAPQDDQLNYTYGAAHTIASLGNSTPIIGLSATRQTLLEQAGSYRSVCFLGHAHFDSNHPMLSRLQLVDGTLQAGEILRELRLKADLVVLAACESGRSHVLRGDEILGLSRSLLYAGTPCLLATLWKVHEVPTRLLIENFFTRLYLSERSLTEFDPGLALASAQCWVSELTCAEVRILMDKWDELSTAKIEEWLTKLWQVTHPEQLPQAESQLFIHPFFWSPYILIGNRPPS